MRNKAILALAMAVTVSAPAFAAVQNVKVSGDIDSTYINRNHFNLGVRASGNGVETGLVDQNVFVTQTRLRVDADLSDNVSTTVGLVNERAWNAESQISSASNSNGSTQSGSDTNVQLYLAYATLREFLYSPLTLSVGRQVFHYGNGLIMGDGGQNNLATGNLSAVAADLTKRTTYDGVKAILDYKPLTLDLIYVRNNQGNLTGNPVSENSNSDIFGVNANYQLGDAMNTVAELYFFGRINGGNNTSTIENKGDTLYVPGLRVSTNPIKGLNVGGELAWQLGNKAVTGGTADGDGFQRNAMAAQVMASYSLPTMEQYKPMVNASFTHLSGDEHAGIARDTGPTPASREHYRAWDPFNEAQGGGTIYNTIFDLTNMNIVAAGGTISPLEDVTASFLWSGLWADKKHHSSRNALTFRQPDGSSVTPTTSSRKDLGNEYDVNINYAYTEDVSFGVNLGWFVPGKTFTNANDSTASQALAHVLVNF